MAAEQYPTLQFAELHGVFADIPCIRLADGRVVTGRFRIAVIGHATQGHVALIVESPPGRFVARLLNRDEATMYTGPLLQGNAGGRLAT